MREPLPQKEARHRPIMAMTTTEQAAGTAWLLPRNCVARRPARVELCIPVQSEMVRHTGSSCLGRTKKEKKQREHEKISHDTQTIHLLMLTRKCFAGIRKCREHYEFYVGVTGCDPE